MNHLPRKVHKMFFICNDSFKSVQFVEHAAKMLQVKKKKRCTTHALRTYVSMKMLMGKLDTFSSAAERRSKAFSVGWYVWSELSIIWKKVTQNANGVLWLGRQTNTTGGAVSERVRVSSVSVGISHFDNHLTLFGWHLPPRHHRQLPIRKESEEEREKEVDRHRSQETLVSSPCCCYSRPFICLHSSSLLILITTSWSDHRESGHQFAVDWFAVITDQGLIIRLFKWQMQSSSSYGLHSRGLWLHLTAPWNPTSSPLLAHRQQQKSGDDGALREWLQREYKRYPPENTENTEPRKKRKDLNVCFNMNSTPSCPFKIKCIIWN